MITGSAHDLTVPQPQAWVNEVDKLSRSASNVTSRPSNYPCLIGIRTTSILLLHVSSTIKWTRLSPRVHSWLVALTCPLLFSHLLTLPFHLPTILHYSSPSLLFSNSLHILSLLLFELNLLLGTRCSSHSYRILWLSFPYMCATISYWLFLYCNQTKYPFFLSLFVFLSNGL